MMTTVAKTSAYQLFISGSIFNWLIYHHYVNVILPCNWLVYLHLVTELFSKDLSSLVTTNKCE